MSALTRNELFLAVNGFPSHTFIRALIMQSLIITSDVATVSHDSRLPSSRILQLKEYV